MSIYCTIYLSPIGMLTLASDGRALVGLWIEGQRHWGTRLLADARACPDLSVFKDCAQWLDCYFRGERPLIDDLPLAPMGTPFQQKVWRLLREIPYGATVSYGSLAQKLQSSPRAVGGAVGRNPISIIIPCHRVVGGKGQITGYAGGVDKKAWLLSHEQSGISCQI